MFTVCEGFYLQSSSGEEKADDDIVSFMETQVQQMNTCFNGISIVWPFYIILF